MQQNYTALMSLTPFSLWNAMGVSSAQIVSDAENHLLLDFQLPTQQLYTLSVAILNLDSNGYSFVSSRFKSPTHSCALECARL